MLESIKKIGEILLATDEASFEVARIKGKDTLLAKVIFDLDNIKLDCDCGIQCDESRAKEFFWVGNSVGQRPQLVLTTDKIKYLLDPSNRRKWAIGQIIEKTLEMKSCDANLGQLQSILCEVKDKFFSQGKNLVQDFEALLAQKGYNKRDISLYTTCVRKNGKVIDLVKEPGYIKLLCNVLYETGSREYPIMRGRCHICGEEKDVLTNPAYPEGTLLCIYNVDKTGFLPNLGRSPQSFLKAHVVCLDCKKKLRLGLNFIEGNLRVRIGEISTIKLNAYLIPSIIGNEMTKELFDKFTLQMKNTFDTVRAYKSLNEIENIMEVFRMFGDIPSTYFLNILFGYRVSSHFAYQCLIQNVPVTRLIELGRVSLKFSNEAAALFTEDPRRWSLGFEDIFAIFPLEKNRNVVDWKPIIELFNTLLSGTLYPKDNIIFRAVLFARINRYETYARYNIRPHQMTAEEYMCRGLLKYNLLLKYLAEIGVIEMEQESIKNLFKVPDENVEKFLSEQGYSEWQRALFILGVLIGKIGMEQYKIGDKKKAILNKVNFEGMSAEKVKQLANYVLEGLRNYRALDSRNEALYGYMKTLLDRNLAKLQNPIDNTFYILSGYGYITLQAITGGDKYGGEHSK